MSALPNYRINEIDTLVRKLVKRKSNLPTSTPNEFLYDKSFGNGVKSFEEIHAAQIIANTISMRRSKGTVGAFLSEVSEFYKKQTKIPLDIYEGPLQFTLGQ